MGYGIGAAYDPSAPAGHIPGFAREERRKRLPRYVKYDSARERRMSSYCRAA
jgi:hypothetical protein